MEQVPPISEWQSLCTNVTIKDTIQFQDLHVVRNLKFPLFGRQGQNQFDLVRCIEAVEVHLQLFTGLRE
jgi:hypothetical protein